MNMKNCKFGFGEMVIPSEYGLKKNIFKKMHLGIVVGGDRTHVLVARQGYCQLRTYSPDFWKSATLQEVEAADEAFNDIQ